MQLRKTLDLYAAVRPVRNLAGVPTRFRGVDLVIIRENTEGLYSGIEEPGHRRRGDHHEGGDRDRVHAHRPLGVPLRAQRGRKKVTVFHKANIMKITDGMFIRCARAVHDAEFPRSTTRR